MTESKFVNILASIFVDEDYIVKKEVGVGYGIADLVLIKKSNFNIESYNLRKSYKQRSKLLKEDYFKVLDMLPEEKANQQIDFDDIVKQTRISKPHLKYNILRNLEQYNYIKIINGRFYVKVNGWLPLAKDVIAIEAKLKNWKRGFLQANRYKVFANRSYLAVPKNIAHLVDKELLRKQGVGLIVLDTSKGTKYTAIAAKDGQAYNKLKHNLAIEFFWNYNLDKTTVPA
ncbi:MAG: hypothetical protein WC412_02170 [Candidatus Omnitrophota bacterium]|jgi:ribosomal protein S8